jgi:hypothetical protein
MWTDSGSLILSLFLFCQGLEKFAYVKFESNFLIKYNRVQILTDLAILE